jgi:aspartyl-tRNA(Asn)/glutamyl-tRNA(Gln) amidotransferase subunit B
MIRIAHEVLGQLGKVEIAWTPDIIPSQLMREIIIALEEGTINGKPLHPAWFQANKTGTTGKSIIRHLIATPPSRLSNLGAILKELGLDASAQSGDLEQTCRDVVNGLPDVAAAIRKGNEKPVMKLVGEVMKRSKGRADPKEARRILLDILKE